jgi:DNA-binding transcriptional LysR family regulator
MPRTGLGEYEAVLVLSRRASFRAAARELGVSPSALSNTVAALEARLGVRLFNRTTRSVSMTEAGEQFVGRLAPALADIQSAVEAVNSHRDTPAGTLRINTTAEAAQLIVSTIMAEYLRRYPQMKIEIATETALVDIVAAGFDAGIRLAEAVPQDMIAVPIGPEQRQVVVGSPSYLDGRTAPQTPGDLLAHDCIRARMASGAIWRWEFERRGVPVAVDVQGPLTLDEPHVMLDAALAGIGLAYLNERQVAPHLAAGRLVRVLEDWTPPYPSLSLYYPGRRHVPAGLRALIDLIRDLRRTSS